MKRTTAQDIMSTELVTIREDSTVEDALKALVNNKITGLPVIDANGHGKMVGVLSEYDLIRQLCKHPEPKAEAFNEKIEFSRNPFGMPANTSIPEIIRQFLDKKYRRIPIVDTQQRLVGIITRRDLMKLYFYRAKLK